MKSSVQIVIFRANWAWLALFAVLVSACSQYSSRPLSVGYHNLTSHYNAYFIARADMDSVEIEYAKKYKENYNSLLPILIPIDTLQTKQYKAKLDDAVKKASKVAEKHQNSKWLDNSYTELGKARYYLGQWDDAIEAFRFVFTNGKDENDKNAALTWLMRAYIDRGDYSNALNVAEYLRIQPLTKTATRDYYLTKAYLHQQRSEYKIAVAILEETLPLMKKSAAKSRISYVSGQLYDKIGLYAEANKHYDKANNSKAPYDLGFFARLNLIQNRVILNPKLDITSVGFGGMLKDRKNTDLKDRIYYIMGLLAEHQGNNKGALGYLQQSVSTGKANTSLLPYTYLEMARIHNDRLGNFELSKMYYDSALAVLPPNSADFKQLNDRKKALDEFVIYKTTIKREDSLQKMASLSPSVLDQRLEQLVEAQEKEKVRKAQEALKAAEAAANTASSASSAPATSSKWALYDPSKVSQGKIDFRKTWGNRILEDNWRISDKQGSAFQLQAAAAEGGRNELQSNSVKSMERGSVEWNAEKAMLKSNLPLSDTALTASKKRVEDALYALGKIYRFDLNEPQNAVATFTRLLTEFPTTGYREEVYYLMVLSMNTNDTQKLVWKNKLIEEYPGSTYAQLLKNFDESAPTVAAGEAEKKYQDLYNLYSQGNYTEALTGIEAAIPRFQKSALKDKFALLRIYLVGKVRGRDAYLQSINEFIRLYPDSPLLPRVQEMLKVTGQASLRRF